MHARGLRSWEWPLAHESGETKAQTHLEPSSQHRINSQSLQEGTRSGWQLDFSFLRPEVEDPDGPRQCEALRHAGGNRAVLRTTRLLLWRTPAWGSLWRLRRWRVSGGAHGDSEGDNHGAVSNTFNLEGWWEKWFCYRTNALMYKTRTSRKY